MSKEETDKLLNQVEGLSYDCEYVTLESKYTKAELERNSSIYYAALDAKEATKKENAINLHKNGASDELIIKSLDITKEKLDEYLKEVITEK